MCNPALQFPVWGAAPMSAPTQHQKLQQELSALPTAGTAGASTQDGLSPGFWAHRAPQGPLLRVLPLPDVPHWGTRTPSYSHVDSKRTEHSCFGGLMLQEVISLPGRRNCPKMKIPPCSHITDISDQPSLGRAAMDEICNLSLSLAASHLPRAAE